MTNSETRLESERAGERPPSPAHVPGEEGVWVLIFGDLVVFTAFFATYLYARGQQSSVFRDSQSTLVVEYGVLNTVTLLTSSLAVGIGMKALRAGRHVLARRLFLGAVACGAAFVLLKALEYYGKFAAGITPATNEFFMYYFALTAIHLVHVLVGMVVLVLMIGAARNGSPEGRRLVLVESGACFWHMVDLIWIVLFPVLYLLSMGGIASGS